MSIAKPHLWIAGVSALLVVAVALVDLRRTSPGPLAAVHGREPDLHGRSCSQCHGGWTSSMTESCLECHAAIEQHVETGAGLHGAIGDLAKKCALCHSEHHGAGFALVNRQSFAQAGVADPTQFEHRMVGFPMDGRHLELTCTECHALAEASVLERGEHRFLGLDQGCASCHEDVHEGRMELGCARCHGQTAFDQLDSRGHEEFLPLTGGHGDVDCRACHAEGGAHALELLGGRARPETRACLDCHDSPHAGTFLRGIGRLFSTSPAASCGSCHEAEHVSFQDERLEVTAAQHASSGFPLSPPHDDATCEDCHAAAGEFALRFPGRERDACHACHADPHAGQFEEGPFAGGCLACHERQHFQPPAFTAREHERTSFALQGTHLELDCASCHLDPPAGGVRVFAGTDPACAACHADAHEGFFVARAAVQDCGTCHLSTTFAEGAAAGFAHGEWTGFEVEGAHAQASCETCHPRAHEPDARGRRFGRVHEAFGRFTGCATCHVDPHEGEFDGPSLPALLDGRAGCDRCHTSVSFRAVRGDFDHELWTGFSLLGRHSETGCSFCHPSLRSPDPVGRTWKRAVGSRCGDCHVDPHGGQFDEAGIAAECESCHASSIAFADLVFDHDRDSVFPLEEAHEALDCGACHAAEGRPEGGSIVRYRPLGAECADCHGVQERVLRKKRKQ